MTFWSVVGKG